MTALEVRADSVEQLDEVFNDDRHVVCGLTRKLCNRRNINDAHRHCLGSALAVGNAELYAAALTNLGALGQSGDVQEYFLTLVRGDEAESLVFIVKLDLAGWHCGAPS